MDSKEASCDDWYRKVEDFTQQKLKSVLPLEAKPKCQEWFDKIKDESDTSDRTRPKFDACRKIYNQVKEEDKFTIGKIFSRFTRKRDQNIGHVFSKDNSLTRQDLEEESNQKSHLFYAGQTASADVEKRGAAPKNNPYKLVPYGHDSRKLVKKWKNHKIRSGSSNSRRRDDSPGPEFIDPVRFSKFSYPKISSFRGYPRKHTNQGRATRAQIFRDRFIRKKMLSMITNREDSWWKNFNVKLYYNDFKN